MINEIIKKSDKILGKGRHKEFSHLISKIKKKDLKTFQKFLMGKFLFAEETEAWCNHLSNKVEKKYRKKLQKLVIESGSAEWCYDFATSVKGTDIPALEKVVIESGDAYWCFEFADAVKGADIRALEKAMVDIGDIDWCYCFASDIKGADKEVLGIEIFEAYNQSYGYLYHHKPTKTLNCGCRTFTYQEALIHWGRGSESGGEKFAKDCVEIAKKLLQSTQENK